MRTPCCAGRWATSVPTSWPVTTRRRISLLAAARTRHRLRQTYVASDSCGRTIGDVMNGGKAEPAAGSDGARPAVVELTTVPGFVVFDLPGAEVSAGGTRLAPGVTVAEVALLARAMTYKFAALEARVGGAKAGLAADPAGRTARADLMARYCAEIRPLTDAGSFLTGPDMGTSEEDFAPLRERRAAPAALRAVVGGMPFEDVLTGYGVAAAAQTALAAGWGGGWGGRSAAIEGFGKAGGGVAREVVRRGGRVAAVSTIAGCITDPAGLDVDRLLTLRGQHGDRCVAHYGTPVGPPGQLFTAVDADVVVPGTRPGVIGRRAAGSLPARPGRRAGGERPLHQERRRRAAPARHRGAARLRLQRRRGNRLPVGPRRHARPGTRRHRKHHRRDDHRGAQPPGRAARRGLRARRRLPADLVGRAARSPVRRRARIGAWAWRSSTRSKSGGVTPTHSATSTTRCS